MKQTIQDSWHFLLRFRNMYCNSRFVFGYFEFVEQFIPVFGFFKPTVLTHKSTLSKQLAVQCEHSAVKNNKRQSASYLVGLSRTAM